MRYALHMVLFLPTILMAEPLRVFVGLLPIQTFVEKVGGDHVDVRALVRPGYNPATYDPTPQQIGALARAALYVRIFDMEGELGSLLVGVGDEAVRVGERRVGKQALRDHVLIDRVNDLVVVHVVVGLLRLGQKVTLVRLGHSTSEERPRMLQEAADVLALYP